MAGITFQEHAFVGLLCAAVLFEDPDDYNDGAARHLDVEPGYLKPGKGRVPARGRSTVVLSLPLMRALMERSFVEISGKFRMGRHIVRNLMNSYPTLRMRRERAIVRRGVVRYKRVLVQYVQSEGGKATRTGAQLTERAAFAWVRKYDPAFLDALLPRRKGSARRTKAASERPLKRPLYGTHRTRSSNRRACAA
jgi:hypothetical protein